MKDGYQVICIRPLRFAEVIVRYRGGPGISRLIAKTAFGLYELRDGALWPLDPAIAEAVSEAVDEALDG